MSEIAQYQPAGTPATFDLSPRTLDEALRFADMIAKADIVPKDYKDKPGNVLIAMQWGMEVGLKPLQAMQNIAVINGRPSLWGDAVLALVMASPVCEYVHETDDGTVSTCRAKRRGQPEQVRTFSDADAKLAGLSSKQGPWTQYPKRMRQMRARAFALRDVFPDVLKGMPIAEEVMDTPADGAPVIASVVADSPRALLIAELEAVAKAGEAGLKDAWTKLGPEKRKLIGTAEWERIKKLVPVGTIEAPRTYAQIAEAIKSATAEQIETISGEIEALPADQQKELLALCAARISEIAA